MLATALVPTASAATCDSSPLEHGVVRMCSTVPDEAYVVATVVTDEALYTMCWVTNGASECER